MIDNKKLFAGIDEIGDIIASVNDEVWNYAEVYFRETKSAAALIRTAEQFGFETEAGIAGIPTAFVCKWGTKGPKIGILAEYDALDALRQECGVAVKKADEGHAESEPGHGCGHNLFGAQSCLTGCALKEVLDEIGGEVRVYGTPGEEGGQNGSSKGSFVREGYFNDVDFAICVHPGSGPECSLTGKNLGCVPIDVEFWGVSSHAAAAPEKGINALDALIMVYNASNALRQQLTDDVRIHGIITNGGKAPNSIPDYAAAKFYLRAASKDTLDEVYAKFENIVKGAELQTGAKGRMAPYQNRVENQVPTPSFDAVFEKNLNLFGRTVKSHEIERGMGSSDVGNVCQVVPTIQPSIGISPEPIKGHSLEMVEASKSRMGLDAIALSANVMAYTCVDIIEDPELQKKIKEDHAYHTDKHAMTGQDVREESDHQGERLGEHSDDLDCRHQRERDLQPGRNLRPEDVLPVVPVSEDVDGNEGEDRHHCGDCYVARGVGASREERQDAHQVVHEDEEECGQQVRGVAAVVGSDAWLDHIVLDHHHQHLDYPGKALRSLAHAVMTPVPAGGQKDYQDHQQTVDRKAEDVLGDGDVQRTHLGAV